MKISQKGIDLITQFEGYRGEAYLCPAKVWTIGFGTTRYPSGQKIKQGDKCTVKEAQAWKSHDLARFESLCLSARVSGVMVDYLGIYNWMQNEFDAMVSFAYNVGSINQLTQNGTRSKAVIADKLPAYNKGGGIVLAGLVRRREAERALFLSPADSPMQGGKNPYAMPSSTIRKGSPKQEVMWLQWQLNGLGYPLVVDGIWGARTDDAVLTFQKNHRLVVDGLVGAKTKAALAG
ncbi:MAG: peptidoglycan-binding protein [Lachnospiraceae bacterium]|nr:peptidoglycan-binding protein [Lachnospiraceae bacterium]